MFCSRCGTSLTPGTKFCGACGAPAGAPAVTPGASGPLQRPGLITVLAVLQLLGGVAWLLGAMGVTAALVGGESSSVIAMAGPMAVVLGACGVLQIVCGVGLLKLKSYGRTLQIVFAVIGLLAIPIGTIIAVLLLIYLNKPGIKTLFSERPAGDLNAEELSDVAAVSKSSTAMIVLIVVAVLVLLIVILGIVAAIAVPGLLRARMSGNEVAAIGSLRSIVSAEATYAATCANGGYAVSLDDLARPVGAGGQVFVGADLGTNLEKTGYRVAIQKDSGMDVADVGTAARTCNGSINTPSSSYFASAEPITPGVTGARYFAADGRGVIFESTAPIANPLVAGPSVQPIR